MNGLEHIYNVFASARSAGRAALMPYYTLGFPSPQLSVEVVTSIARSGADLIELGIPFSDPLADGPTIQHSTQIALEQGTTLGGCLEMAAAVRRRGVSQPLLFMGYYNPILTYGIERFAAASARAGVDGFIIPDLPPEEADEMEAACHRHGLALVFLLAPTSTPERIAEVAARASGFIYLVSLTGVTGARADLSVDLEGFVERVRGASSSPLAVGFGISSPRQAQAVGRLADGVIVGSALIDAVEHSRNPGQAAAAFIQSFRAAL